MTAHADGDPKAYLDKVHSYVSTFYELLTNAEWIAEAREAFDYAMRDLAECIERLCKDTHKEVLVYGRDFEEATAYCPECDLDAAKYNRSLADLLFLDAFLAERIAERAKLLGASQGRRLTAEEQQSLGWLDGDIKRAEQDKPKALRDLRMRRADLDACNKAHPAESCKPPATTGQNILPGGTTIQPFGGGTGIPGGIQPGPGPKVSVGGAGTAPSTEPPKSSGAPATTTPLPGGPADTRPPAPPPALFEVPEAVQLPRQGSTDWGLVANYVDRYTLGGGALNPESAGSTLAWPESPPKTLPTGEAFTFEVKGDAEALDGVLANPFVFDPHSHALPEGGYIVSSSAGANAEETWANLQALLQSGKIVNLEIDPSWHFLPDSPGVETSRAVHLSDSFGATLLEPYRKTPVPGAYILYGPLPPTPFFNPGERQGDDQAPRIVRSDGSGAYRASLGGFSGPIEIRAAKGPDERRAFAIVDSAIPPAAASAAMPGARSTSELRNP